MSPPRICSPVVISGPPSALPIFAACAAAMVAFSLPGQAQQLLIPESHSWNFLHPMGTLPPRADTTPDPNFATSWYLPEAQFLTNYDGPSFSASTFGDPLIPTSADSGPGSAPFAYGGVDGIAAPGTALTRPETGNRYTSYYRTVFTVPAGGLKDPSLRMVCDDGCFIYLDGVLIATVNVTDGITDTYTSFASDATNTEGGFSFSLRVAGTLPGGSPGDVKVLVPVPAIMAGVHTLAVSVHNSGTASSDMGLLLELSALDLVATVTEAKLDNSGYRFTIVDDPASVVQTGSITLDIDGALVTPTSITKTAGVTSVFYAATGLPPGSNHTYALAAKDQNNATITGSGTVRSPYFPTAALPGPSGSPGMWGMREYRNGTGWGSGLDVAVTEAAALPAVDPDPLDGSIVDGSAPVINHTDPEQAGTGGNFNNDLPFIGNLPDTDDNVMVIAKTQIVITAAGPVTYSVHSDDGMALRISGGPPAGAGSKFVSFSGGGLIDQGDTQTLVFPGFTGDSNTRGVYNFTAPGTYDVQFVAFEGAGGSSWEVASAPGTFTADRDTNTWTLLGNPNNPAVLAVPFQPRWITNPPGIPGTAGKFGARTYFSADTVDNLQQVSDFLRDTTRTPEDGDNLTFDILRSSLNARDPGSTNAAQGTILGDDLVNEDPNAPQGANDRVVTVAKGRITVPAASVYTFWARGDDGFLLRLKAVSGPNPVFKRATNGDPNQANGRFEMSNPNELFFDGGTGDSNTRGIIFLAAGQYDIEYLQWEGVGGFWYELTAAVGEFPHGTEPPQGWRLVGYQTPATTIVVPGLAAPGWSVETSLPDTATGALGTITAAEALIDVDKTTTTWAVLNFTDPESGNNGSFTPNNPFPRNTAADDNNYAMRATGNLVIAQAGVYNLGFQGDDGGYMDITGPGNPVWTSVVETNHPLQAVITESVPGSGVNNRLQVEVGTGNSRTIGNITLAAGTYSIKTLVFEGGGGSWWEVIGAKAPVSTGFNYPLLVQGAGSTVTDFDMLILVSSAAETIPVTNFTANPATGAYSLTFVSTAGATYQLEYSTNMEAGAAGTPQKWNVAPGPTIVGAAGTTTLNANLTALYPANGGVLPAGSPRAYLRVRRL